MIQSTDNPIKLFIITGQTATGKTDYALTLAKKYDGELINCDSRQIYKGLDIITGKDLPKDSEFKIQKKLHHFDIGYYTLHSKYSILNSRIWLYDITNPKQYFSSYDYVSCALPVIQDILSRGKVPIIVGGTYFYLYHLLYDVETERIGPDWKLRNTLNKKSVPELQKMFGKLSQKLNITLNQSDYHNPQRLIRKIEILRHYQASKTPPSTSLNSLQIPKEIILSQKLGTDLQIEYRGLYYKNTPKLQKKIKDRVGKRMKSGAIDEVKELLANGYSKNDPGLKTIGYSQIISFLKGNMSKELAVDDWNHKEIQYAKRQYTFMKKDPNIQWTTVD